MWDASVTVNKLPTASQAPIQLPHRYKAYPHQQDLLNTFFDMLEEKNTFNRFALEWHRRAGKDMTFWQLVVAAGTLIPGDYCYMLPSNTQAKKVILNSNVNDMDNNPCKFIDFIPPEMNPQPHKTDSRIELSNGTNLYVLGSDNYDSAVGMNAKGVVYSEWSLCNPKAAEYFSPMLIKNRNIDARTGWSLYCWTPRGKNHAFDTRVVAQKEMNKAVWYFSSKTILDTSTCDGEPIFSEEQVQAEIDAGADPDIARQEYYLDYDAVVKGVIYSRHMQKAREENRVCDLFNGPNARFNPRLPVHTVWDLGIADATAIIFYQQGTGRNKDDFIILDYYEDSDVGFDAYLDYMEGLKQELGFARYGYCHLPHDGGQREWGSGEKRVTKFHNAGLKTKIVSRIGKLENGIDQTKTLFPNFYFDENRTHSFIGLLG